MNGVILYSKKDCPQCRMTKRVLVGNDVPYIEINIEEDEQARNFLLEKGFKSLPVVQHSCDEFIIGFKPKELELLTA